MQSIATIQIFGKPLILYTGMLVSIMLLLAVLLGIMARKGKDPKMHITMAKLTVFAAAIHAFLGILMYF